MSAVFIIVIVLYLARISAAVAVPDPFPIRDLLSALRAPEAELIANERLLYTAAEVGHALVFFACAFGIDWE